MLIRVSSMKMLSPTLLRSLLSFLILLPSLSLAQSYSGYNWYFGGSQFGIRFSRSDGSATLVTNQAPAFGNGGSAVASDAANGDLLFYTDGNNIYDRSHTVMPNGTGLGANTAGNQPVAIAKVPGQDNQYYVFTNSANGTTAGSISYRIVDISLGGNAAFPLPPAGEATTAGNTAVPGHASTSEAMMVIPHANGDDFWLITHANGTPDYTVTQFTPSGPTTTTTFTGLGLIETVENFSYHPGTGRIAVSPHEGTRDVEIINFDPATGGLTFQQTVLNSGVASTTNPAVYDTEWSANGQYLYISRTGEAGIPADVLQYDLNNPSNTLASILPASPAITNSYGLQMGPDSTIYHIYQTAPGTFLVGQISDTDSVSNLVQYDPQPFGTPPPNFNGTQFPSFAPRDTVDMAVSFTSEGLCANAPTSFFPTVSPTADSLRWDFGDGSFSSDWSPVYTYQAGGAFNVSVTAFLNGQTETATNILNITDFDTQINLVQDTTACSCELPFSKKTNPPSPPPNPCTRFTVQAQVNGSGTPQLQWYGPSGLLAGQTTNTLSPDSAGYYYLVATVGGCSTYAGVNIKEYTIQDQRANIWYFGNNAGIDFNPLPDDPAKAISNPVMNAPEGTATISDRNGQVIFFTDGDKVWDRSNTEIATGIGGEPGASQSALIIPVPGDETLFYIFTTKEVYGTGTYEVRYSLFDLKLNNGTGGLVEQNVLLFARSTERLTGNANWLIAHEYGNNSFRAYRITQQGISNPVISSIGSDHAYAYAENGQGYMKLGSQNRLAVALSTPGVSNVVEVFDFTDSTGVVSNFRTANLNEPNGQVYGVEVSPGGNKLFATLQNGGTSRLVEFAFDSLGIPYLKKPPVAPVTEKLGAIQVGPDGQLYVASDGQQYLKVIQVVEDTTQVSVFQPTNFDLLGGTNSNLGLPNFIQTIADPIQGPGISVSGACIRDSVTFAGAATDPIDEFFWQLSQAGSVLTTSDQETFAYVFNTPGNYSVSLRLTNRCGLDTTMTQNFIINDVPPNPTASVVLCTGSQTLDANPGNLPGLTYVWSTGDSTETITVNRQAIYRVTVTNAAGCVTNGDIRAVDNRPIVNLGNDITICQNTPIAPLNAQNPGATYAWEYNDVPNGNTSRTQSVNTSLVSPPTSEYKVTITDPITSCFVKDSVVYTINPSPVITPPVVGHTSDCALSDGSISFTITGPPSSLFTYSITGPSTASDIDQPTGTNVAAGGLDAGTYGITVADQVTGCALINTATINDGTFTATTNQVGTCDPLAIQVTPAGGVVYPVTYRVINAATALQVGNGSVPAGPNFNTQGLPSGNYVVEITANNGCRFSAPATLTQNPPLVVTFDDTDICNGTITAIAAGATTFNWSASDAGSLTNPGSSAMVTVNEGTYTLRVTTDAPPGSCPGTDSTTVTIDNFIPTFSQTDACQDQVTLTATPASGPYTYRWYRNGVLVNGGGGRQIVAYNPLDDNVPYYVQVVSSLNGCAKTTPPVPVQVDGELTVSLVTTTPCEGSPFTLTATPNRSASFQWSIDGALISGEIGPTLNENRAGTYTVTATSASCTATADLDIILAPVTPGLLREEAFICPDPANPNPETRQIVLDPGDFTSYDWYRNGVSLSWTDPTYTAAEPGIFSVNLINAFGCASNDKTEVFEECDPVIVGPNAFRPTSNVTGMGGDKVNQSFRLFTFFIDDEDFQVFIFNRWGEMIYQSPERDFKWNGGYNNNLGQLLPPGTYSYVVRYKSSYRPEEGIQEKRGGVVLLR
ncbi:PKD domain-containing protein [Chryseolinea sp. H1M3-3]|uniref:T9SS type B sorting domain-containing protein n=1 Tax=Chryseolinea sp. H1M3-3 TaxID=3034144 RepID=UPI0023EA7AE7|nr:PKD domain-containing protein [Chryseolinea sp. H1M3-3]